MKPKYKIGDIVMYGDSSIFCEFFPMEVKLVSNRKIGLFGYFYYTRVREWMPDGIHEYRTICEEQSNKQKFQIIGRTASDYMPIGPFDSIQDARSYIDEHFNFENYYRFTYLNKKMREEQRSEWYELLIKPIN